MFEFGFDIFNYNGYQNFQSKRFDTFNLRKLQYSSATIPPLFSLNNVSSFMFDPRLLYPQMNFNYPGLCLNVPQLNFTNTQQNNSTNTQTTNNSSTPTKQFGYKLASGYNGLTNDQLRQIYGNYTKDVTVLYKGTAEDLNKYLKGKGKLEGKGQAFIDAQNKYGISAAVLVGICVNESGAGKSKLARKQNNVGGVRISGSYNFRSFSSVEECIDYMGSFLKKGYLDRGLLQLYQINARYCPASDPTDKTGGNSRWARAVNKFSNDVEAQLA